MMIKIVALATTLLVSLTPLSPPQTGRRPPLVGKMKRTTLRSGIVACASPDESLTILSTGSVTFRKYASNQTISGELTYTTGYGRNKVSLTSNVFTQKRVRVVTYLVDGVEIDRQLIYTHRPLSNGRLPASTGVDFPMQKIEAVSNPKVLTVVVANSVDNQTVRLDFNIRDLPAVVWVRDNKFNC